MPPDLSIVIPAFNEGRRIGPSLEKIRDFLTRDGIAAEVIVVDDGSTDDTIGIVRQVAAVFDGIAPLRALSNQGNRGKGYSVRHGALEARGSQILYTDADLSSPIEEYRKLRAALEANRAQVALGSRALPGSDVRVRQPLLREASGRVFNLVVRTVAGLPFRDTQCGFKLFTAEAARAIFPLQSLDGFGFDVEILFLARKLGFATVEVPVVWYNAEGTRVGLLSGARAFLDVLQIRYRHLTGAYQRGRTKP